jgi:hypothetical protein
MLLTLIVISITALSRNLRNSLINIYSDGKYFFWPNLAPAHYANDTMNAYEMLGIKVLPKDQNPPNVPQLRPTERVWAELKKSVFANGWAAETTLKLREKIKRVEKFTEIIFSELDEWSKN